MKSLEVIDVNLDITEMVLQIKEGSSVHAKIVKYTDIEDIKFAEFSIKKWFKKASARSIEIHLKGKKQPLIIKSDKLKVTFDAIVDYLKKMAEKHKINISE